MKNLTIKQLQEAPSIVQYLYIAGVTKQSVGSKIIDEGIEKYPEYFPDEVEYRRKWALVPQEVHDNYWKEYWDIEKELFKDVPPNEGLMAMCNNTEKYQTWNKMWNIANEKAKPLRKKLHEKFYSKYEIEWDGL